MPHLWASRSNLWEPIALSDAVFEFLGDAQLGKPNLPNPGSSSWLRRVGEGAAVAWVLIAPASRLLVNGTPVVFGISVLADRDEIRLPDGRQFFFSTEMLACVEPFPGTGVRGFCPRC